jgi:nicotinate-nucleotide adenylyltransferase
MKIGIFGGSFNPTHKGHLIMASHVKEKLNLDRVFMVPTYITPDKQSPVEKINSKDRYNILKKSVKDFNQR